MIAPHSNWQVEVFFDGACPLCRREIAVLKRLDRRGKVLFTDIAAPDFVGLDLAGPNCDDVSAGVSWDDLMSEIHGRLPDGRIVRGVEVFRRIYAALGFGAISSLTRLPLVAPALEMAYGVFARNRLRWTGRCTDACKVGPQT